MKALEVHNSISDIARRRSRLMAASKTMSHSGFDWAAGMLKDITPYSYAAENLSSNWGFEDPAEAALEGWIKSDKHRLTMLETFDLTGVGVARDSLGTFYFTQLFVRSR
jgi:uncharacterized protein YkwD